ncbi:MAG: malectin domain-containing carbohydrate-binding protein [Bacillota bacterium]
MRRRKGRRILLFLGLMAWALFCSSSWAAYVEKNAFPDAAGEKGIVRVNCGGGAYKDKAGNFWSADQAYQPGGWGYTGGDVAVTKHNIGNTADGRLFQSARVSDGSMGYRFTVENGNYYITLMFAETEFERVNQRVFDIGIEGMPFITGLDLIASAGHDFAHEQTFAVTVSDGILNIDFANGIDKAAIAAIKVISGAGAIYYVAPGGSDDNPGGIDKPWATIQKAADTLQAGDTIYIRGGRYQIATEIEPKNSGSEGRWITYAGYPGETPVIDADNHFVKRQSGTPPYDRDQGAFQIQGKSYLCIRNLRIEKSHNAGFTVRRSHHIDFYNNSTYDTFSSGIAIWDGCHDHKVMGNTVEHAHNPGMATVYPGGRREGPPHEAITVSGSRNCEVAYNHVFNCFNEGIDFKGANRRGRIHHNYVHGTRSLGIYVDGWGSTMSDIEVYENVVHDCMGGVIVSSEGGSPVDDVRIHHNLVYQCRYAGIEIDGWLGRDGPRSNIRIYNNTVYLSGNVRGGIFIGTFNLKSALIRNNISSSNWILQIGTSGHKLDAFKIVVDYNLCHGKMETGESQGTPMYPVPGFKVVHKDPMFIDRDKLDFYLQKGSPAINAGHPDRAYRDPDGSRGDLGAFYYGMTNRFWWKTNFPPVAGR